MAAVGQRYAKPSLSPRPTAAKKSFTVWMYLSMLMGVSPFSPGIESRLIRSPGVVSLPVGTSCSSVELDQVLEDQMTPAVSTRLDQQSAFRKPTKFDWRETEIFCKRTN